LEIYAKRSLLKFGRILRLAKFFASVPFFRPIVGFALTGIIAAAVGHGLTGIFKTYARLILVVYSIKRNG
jgi:hypothetical protein